MAGGFLGGRDVFKPLPRNLLTNASTRADTSPAVLRSAAPLFERIATMEKLDLRLEDARRSGKPVILDYYATWCTDCERMEQSTFRDPAVRSAIRARFVALQADVTESGVDSSAMKKRFGVYGPPALVFLRADGAREADKPFYGYHSPSELLEILSAF